MKRTLLLATLLLIAYTAVSKVDPEQKLCRPVKSEFNNYFVKIYKNYNPTDKNKEEDDDSIKIFTGEIFITYGEYDACAKVKVKGQDKFLKTDYKIDNKWTTMLDGDKKRGKSDYPELDIKFFLYDDSLYLKVPKQDNDTTKWFYVIDQTNNEKLDSCTEFNAWKHYPVRNNSKDFRVSPESHLVSFIHLPKVNKNESLKDTIISKNDTLIRNNHLAKGDTLISEMLILDNDTIWVNDKIYKASTSSLWQNIAWIVVLVIVIIVAICLWKRKDLASVLNKLAKEKNNSIEAISIEDERQEQSEQEIRPSTLQEGVSDTLEDLPANILDDDKRSIRELLDELPDDYDGIKALIERRHDLDLRIISDHEHKKYNKQIELILSQQGETRKINEDADAVVEKTADNENNTEVIIADLETNFRFKLQNEREKIEKDAKQKIDSAEEKQREAEEKFADLETNFRFKLQNEREKIEKDAKQRIEKAEKRQKEAEDKKENAEAKVKTIRGELMNEFNRNLLNEKEKYEKRIKSLKEENAQIGRQLGEIKKSLSNKENALKERESELATSQVAIKTLQVAQAKFTNTLTYVPYAQNYVKNVMELILLAENIRNSATKLLDKKSVEDPYHIMKCLAKYEKAIAAINMSQFYTDTKMITEGQMVLKGTAISTYDQNRSKEQLYNSLKIYFFDAYLHRFINGVAVLNESCIGLDRLVIGLKKEDVNEFLTYRNQLHDCVNRLEIILESTHLFDKVGQKTDLRVTLINAGFSAGDILEIENCIVYLKGSYRPDTKIYVKAQS